MRQSVTTSDAPSAIGPYSQGLRHGDLLWASGQLGVVPASGALVGDGVAEQAEQALRNLDAVCREAGTSLVKAVKCTVYLTDMADFPVVNTVYERFFEVPYPARATVQVAALPRGGRVEIDAVVAL